MQPNNFIQAFLESRTPTQIRRIIAITFIVFILIVITISIFFLTRPDTTPRIIISDFSESSSTLTSNQIVTIEQSLGNHAQYVANDENASHPTALMRLGTYRENIDESNYILATFIVDIDKYKQTYEISSYFDNTGSIIDFSANCPHPNLMKYPDTICVALYGDTTIDTLIGDLLPYSTTYNGISYIINQNFDDNLQPYLRITIDGCVNESTSTAITNEAKSWLTTHDINLNTIPIKTINLCASSHTE